MSDISNNNKNLYLIKKENIIIDNSLITKDHINNMVSCEN